MPPKIEDVVSEVVSLLAVDTKPFDPTASQHQKGVRRIIDRLWGAEWRKLEFDEQEKNWRAIRSMYVARFKDYLRAFPTRPDATQVLDELESAPYTGPVHQPEDVFDGMTEEEILQTDLAQERDQAAKENLKDLYEACRQGQADVVVRRAKAKDVNVVIPDFKTFPVHNKKKTCPVCEKNISSNAIKRHYQAKHAKDSRKALFCPKCAHVDWRGDCTILEHMENKHGISIERKRNNTSKGKATKSDSSEDDSEEAEEAEGHEEDEEIDGEEMIDMAP